MARLDGFEKLRRVVCGVGLLLFGVGVILLVVTLAAAPPIETLVDGVSEFSLDLSDPSHCGYTLYAAADTNCDAVYGGIHVTDPLGHNVTGGGSGMRKVCCPPALFQSWEGAHDPMLQKVALVGHVESSGERILGSYRVASAVGPMWAINFCEEEKNVVEALVRMLSLFLLSLLVMLAALVLCCVTCCCLKPWEAQSEVAVVSKEEAPEFAW